MQYDASTKYLVNQFPVDWLILAGVRPTGPVDLIDANLSTVTAEADKVIRIGGPDPSLTHIELQASRDVRLGCRLFRYNALIDDRHNLPTRSVVVLLSPEADSADLTGEYRRTWPDGSEYLVFAMRSFGSGSNRSMQFSTAVLASCLSPPCPTSGRCRWPL